MWFLLLPLLIIGIPLVVAIIALITIIDYVVMAAAFVSAILIFDYVTKRKYKAFGIKPKDSAIVLSIVGAFFMYKMFIGLSIIFSIIVIAYGFIKFKGIIGMLKALKIK